MMAFCSHPLFAGMPAVSCLLLLPFACVPSFPEPNHLCPTHFAYPCHHISARLGAALSTLLLFYSFISLAPLPRALENSLTSFCPLSAHLTSAWPTGLLALSGLVIIMPPSLFLSHLPSITLHLPNILCMPPPALSTIFPLTSPQLCPTCTRFVPSDTVSDHPYSVACLATS
jgi:hypothetical protein